MWNCSRCAVRAGPVWILPQRFVGLSRFPAAEMLMVLLDFYRKQFMSKIFFSLLLFLLEQHLGGWLMSKLYLHENWLPRFPWRTLLCFTRSTLFTSSVWGWLIMGSSVNSLEQILHRRLDFSINDLCEIIPPWYILCGFFLTWYNLTCDLFLLRLEILLDLQNKGHLQCIHYRQHLFIFSSLNYFVFVSAH